MKILIVDDDENSRIFLERALRSQGYEIDSACNGEVALEKAQAMPPEMIISDIMMPKMNGFEFCYRIKTDARLHSIPFIFYTATFVGEEDERLALSLGASRFLVKPMEPLAFFKIIREQIAEYQARQLAIPEAPRMEEPVLEHMQSEALARKLDKKVQELGKALARAKTSEEQERRLLYMAGHDMRAPATIINGQLELIINILQGSELARQLQPHTDALQRALRRMNTMINDLTVLPELEEGRLLLVTEPVTLTPYLAELLRRNADVLATAGIEVALPGDLPAAKADPYYLERIFLNLFSHARKYATRDTPITVTARAQDNEVLIAITNRGPGIPIDDLPHLFDRFYRPTQGRLAEGIGLGLYLTKRLLEAHHGRIWVENEVGQRSAFYFTLPIAIAPDSPG